MVLTFIILDNSFRVIFYFDPLQDATYRSAEKNTNSYFFRSRFNPAQGEAVRNHKCPDRTEHKI